MFVEIATTDSRAHAVVVDADDCSSLKVVGRPGMDVASIVDLLVAEGIAEAADDGHVALSVAWLRGAARGQAVGEGWDDRFDAMLKYARTRGWCDSTGRFVTAHITQ